MFFNFVDELRSAGISASFKEHLTLIEALDRDVIEQSPEAFYYLSRATFVKDEGLLASRALESAGCWCEQAGGQAQKGALSAAAGAHKRKNLPGLDHQVQAGTQSLPVGPGKGEVLKADGVHGWLGYPHLLTEHA